MKWFCDECKEFFDEPAKERESHPELGGDGITYEVFTVCPICGSEDIHECEKCDGCGEEVIETECFGYHTYLCEDCRRKVEDKLVELRDYVQAEFDINDYREAEEIIQDIADALFD